MGRNSAYGIICVSISLSAINLSPMPIEQCQAWRMEQPEQRLCVEVEPPCGKDIGVECLGRADLEAKKPTYRKKYYTKNGRRYYRLVKQ